MGTCKIIAVANQKGGVGKTTTCVNLGIGLAGDGKRVLLVDLDAQGSMTECLGYQEPDALTETIAMIMSAVINDEDYAYPKGIIHHPEGVDLIPSNIELSGLEVSLVNVMSRELILKQYLESVEEMYDYILIDCMPSLGMLTINALACADTVLIPVQAAYLPVKGLEQLLKTIGKVRRQLNRKLEIEGIIMTMVDNRTNLTKSIAGILHEVYGANIKVFENSIPFSVRAAESTAEGSSIFLHDPKGKVAESYRELTAEVLEDEE